MAVYIDSAGRLHHEQQGSLALACPHCQVLAHITPMSVPDYNLLQLHKPSQVGLVYRCEACNAPIFLRFTVKLTRATGSSSRPVSSSSSGRARS